MVRARLIVVLLLVAALAAAAGSAAKPRPSGLITTTRIGTLKLGMRAQAVRKALPGKVRRRWLERRINVRPGVQYIEYQYGRSLYGPFYWVGVLGPPGRRHIAQIRTDARGYRTREGVRVGATERKVLLAYRARLRCGRLSGTGGGFGYCTLSGRHGQIGFLTKSVYTPPAAPESPTTVVSIVVRERGLRISPAVNTSGPTG